MGTLLNEPRILSMTTRPRLNGTCADGFVVHNQECSFNIMCSCCTHSLICQMKHTEGIFILVLMFSFFSTLFHTILLFSFYKVVSSYRFYAFILSFNLFLT